MYQEETLLNFIKLGLYFSLIGEGRLDPMLFELISEERRLREQTETADSRKAQHEQPGAGDDMREAA